MTLWNDSNDPVSAVLRHGQHFMRTQELASETWDPCTPRDAHGRSPVSQYLCFLKPSSWTSRIWLRRYAPQRNTSQACMGSLLCCLVRGARALWLP